jgi:Family of unknown function (DUF6454)
VGYRFSGAALAVAALGCLATAAAPPTLADRVVKLTRESRWLLERTIPVQFKTFHPQGMIKIDDRFFVSSVEVARRTQPYAQPAGGFDRDTGAGVGHVFVFDGDGRQLGDIRLGEGSIYHPGGVDFDGTAVWVPVAEYRPNSRSIVYRVDPRTMKATEVLRVADHIGAIVHDTDDRTLHGISWGSRRFYRWTLGPDGVTNASAPLDTLRVVNPSHYIDYQDCKYAGSHRMVCTGVAEIRQTPDASPFRLGGIDLVDLRDARPLHQVPVLLWTAGGLDMTHNPVWLEPTDTGLRAYFMPEDDTSTIYVYQVDTR